MSKAAGVLGLRAHEVEGVFLALEQMLSKGKVTTEELRRQLGERLPGAFGVMAQTVQQLNPDIEVTVQTLDDMLKRGQVLSAEVLPKFSQVYNETFGIDKVHKVETLAAAEQRLSTAWTKFVYDVEQGNSILTKAFTGFYDMVSGLLNELSDDLTIMAADDLTFWDKNKILAQSKELKKIEADRIRALRLQKTAIGELMDLKQKLYLDENLREMGNLAYEREKRKWAGKSAEEIMAEIERINQAREMENLLTKERARSIAVLDKEIEKIEGMLKTRYDLTDAGKKEAQQLVAQLKLLKEQKK